MTDPVEKHKIVDPMVIELLKTVQCLTDKVSQLETAIDKINANIKRDTKGRSSSRKGESIVTRLNESDNSLPAMNLDSFIDFLTQMSYDAENIMSKKNIDIIADFVSNGCTKLRNRHTRCQDIILPIASFTECPTMLFMFDTEWRICTPALFSQVLRRFHLCIMSQCERWREKNVGPPRPLHMVTSNVSAPARDPRAIAKDQKISTKIYSLNISSTRFISHTKSLICTATVINEK